MSTSKSAIRPRDPAYVAILCVACKRPDARVVPPLGRGLWFECSTCGHVWKLARTSPPSR